MPRNVPNSVGLWVAHPGYLEVPDDEFTYKIAGTMKHLSIQRTLGLLKAVPGVISEEFREGYVSFFNGNPGATKNFKFKNPGNEIMEEAISPGANP